MGPEQAYISILANSNKTVFMLADWIVLFLLITIPIVAAVSGRSIKALPPQNRLTFYLKDIITSLLILSIFFFLEPSAFNPLDFSKIDKGTNISEELLSSIGVIFLVPFLLSFTRLDTHYPKDIAGAKEIFGYPVSYLPNTTTEYLLFTCYIIVGVFFEELLCRQLMFHSMSTTLNLKGDILIIVASLLFACGHIYQGWKGVFSSFVIGLILGKLFLLKETLAYPIILHMFLNSTIVVLAFRRWKDLRKINRETEDISLTNLKDYR